MDMKKNWVNLCLAGIFGVMSILYFIALIDMGFSFHHLGPLAIAPLIFLLGFAIYFVCETYMPEFGHFALLIAGVINVILVAIAFINVADVLSALTFNIITLTFLLPLTVYALLPLFSGLKKVLSDDKDKRAY